jgi:signal peptidase I
LNKLNFEKQTLMQRKGALKAFKNILNNIILLSIVISLAVFSFSYYFIDVEVIGPSMQPTINSQWEDTTEGRQKRDTAYIKKGSGFDRGDIIVLETGEDLYIIKRLIATEGDKVNIIENNLTGEIEVYINDELLIEDYVVFKDGMNSTFNNFNNLRLDKPELFIGEDLIVPEDYIFYLGDNRGRSLDSSTEGPVSKSKVVGRVGLVVSYGDTFVEHLLKEFFALFN